MHWPVAGASDAHAMSVMASALELREGRSRRVERALSLTHTHTQVWAAGGDLRSLSHKFGKREAICEREAREETGCAAWLGSGGFEQVGPCTGVLWGSQAGL